MSTQIIPLARNEDRLTSFRAGDQVNKSSNAVIIREAICELLEENYLTDHEITEKYFEIALSKGWPKVPYDSIRKRRADLLNLGLVEAIGTTKGIYGADVTVWGLVQKVVA